MLSSSRNFLSSNPPPSLTHICPIFETNSGKGKDLYRKSYRKGLN